MSKTTSTTLARRSRQAVRRPHPLSQVYGLTPQPPYSTRLRATFWSNSPEDPSMASLAVHFIFPSLCWIRDFTTSTSGAQWMDSMDSTDNYPAPVCMCRRFQPLGRCRFSKRQPNFRFSQLNRVASWAGSSKSILKADIFAHVRRVVAVRNRRRRPALPRIHYFRRFRHQAGHSRYSPSTSHRPR